MGGDDRADLKDDSLASSDSDVMIRLSHVDKVYRLGEIGYGTLRQDFTSYVRRSPNLTGICAVETISTSDNTALMDGSFEFDATIRATEARSDVSIRLVVSTPTGMIVGMTFSEPFDLPEGRTTLSVKYDVAPLTPGVYACDDDVVVEYRDNTETRHDFIRKAVSFLVEENIRYYGRHWKTSAWGNVKLVPVTASKVGGNVVQKEW